MTLLELRRAIDRLDAQIVRLLNRRTQLVREIGALKRKSGEEVYAPDRERAVLQRVCGVNTGPLADDGLRAIYREIMSSALAVEKPMTIAYLGPEATFTHQAALKRFGTRLRYVPLKTIAEVFNEVAKRRVDFGVVPIENSTEGVVTHTQDMFADSDLRIVAQIVLPVQHCLLSRGTRPHMAKLYVHPQTLAQCRGWIQKNLPGAEIIETSSNARSAEFAARDHHAAAIAGLLAAEKYKLPILEHDVQDSAANATRFLVLGRQCAPPSDHDRTSIMFCIADKVGALYSALAPFRRYRINMTKIESRPSKRKAWEYYFFVDIDGHEKDRRVARALAQLREHCVFVKVLGSYPNTD
jgi:chorismate mutase/prephenate dehydratase